MLWQDPAGHSRRFTQANCVLPVPWSREQKGREGDKRDWLLPLILVKNHPIHHHVIARPDVVNPDGNTDSNSRSYGVFVQDFATSRHIGDRFSEVVSPWAAGFSEYDCASRSVLGDRAVAFRCSRRSGSL